MKNSVVTHEEWLAERNELRLKEESLDALYDQVAEARRKLPWVRIDKPYVFESETGLVTLAQLFDGRSQLVIYHFMYSPEWEEGCPGCSFLVDHLDGANLHLKHRDISLVVVSRASITKLSSFKARMGWKFNWVSSLDSDFNFDYQASYRREDLDAGDVLHNFYEQKLRGEEQPGLSVFYRDEDGSIYHTYSCYERGVDPLLTTTGIMDFTPKGRNEESPLSWVRFHDEY